MEWNLNISSYNIICNKMNMIKLIFITKCKNHNNHLSYIEILKSYFVDKFKQQLIMKPDLQQIIVTNTNLSYRERCDISEFVVAKCVNNVNVNVNESVKIKYLRV